jgi:pimeloyl-ACP methyl ester carboxylesterase
MRRIWILPIAALACAAAYCYADLHRAYGRIRSQGEVLSSPFGDIEYLEGGDHSGTPVLVIHGSGGGYDQGELMARAVLGDRFHWIAPSRFGYLRSTFHPGATFDDQAHAYAFLLDRLGIRKAAVIALSHGGPSALLFAALYPERVTSLTLISAGVAATAAPDQQQANLQGRMLTIIFRYDPVYWLISKLARGRLMKLMGASDEVVSALTADQRQLVDELIDWMNPVAPRSAGTAFDNQAAMPNERIAAIRAPTLIFHARDDTLQVFDYAVFAAARIPGAQLTAFERGGHLVMAVEQARISTNMQQHIRANAD